MNRRRNQQFSASAMQQMPAPTAAPANPAAQQGQLAQFGKGAAGAQLAKSGNRRGSEQHLLGKLFGLASRTTNGRPNAQAFRWLRAMVLLFSFVAAVLAPGAFQLVSDAAVEKSHAVTQVTKLEAVQSDLQAVEANLHWAAASGQLEADIRKGAQDQLRDAATKLAEIAADASGTGQEDAVAQTNAQLVTLTLHVERAISVPQGASASEIASQLDKELLPQLQDQIDYYRQLQTKSDNQAFGILIIILPVAAIGGASVVMAKRTKRVLNIGLVVGLVLSGAGGWLGLQSLQLQESGQDRANYYFTRNFSDAAKYESLISQRYLFDGRLIAGQLSPADAQNKLTELNKELGEIQSVLSEPEQKAALDQLASDHTALLQLLRDNPQLITELANQAAESGANPTAPGQHAPDGGVPDNASKPNDKVDKNGKARTELKDIAVRSQANYTKVRDALMQNMTQYSDEAMRAYLDQSYNAKRNQWPMGLLVLGGGVVGAIGISRQLRRYR